MTPLARITPNTDDYALLVAGETPDEAIAYSMFTDNLIRLLHIKEDAQLAIGDALKDVESVYSECTIQRIADDIGATASSLYSYRDLAECFTPAMRAEYRAHELMFSHLREAYRLDTFEAIHDFLAACILNAWTTRQAAIEVRKLLGQSIPPRPIFAGVVTFTRIGQGVSWAGLEDMGIETGVRYRVRIERID